MVRQTDADTRDQIERDIELRQMLSLNSGGRGHAKVSDGVA